MTIRRDKPNAPPPYYDQRWEYWFWEYVADRFGPGDAFAVAGDLLGTTTTGTLTGALSTTGVSTGVYGGTAGVPRFDISAAGRVTSATNIAVEVQAPILLTKGTGTLQFSINTSGVVAGTYGKADYSARITINDKGIVTAATEVAITGGTGTGIASADASVTAPIIFSVGTGTGAVLQPFTLALATTGVSTGTYGGLLGIPRFDVDAWGRVLTATHVGTLATSLQVGTAVATNALVLNVRGLAKLGRNDTSAEGGQLNLERALDGSSTWLVDVWGTSTTPVYRIINDNVSPSTVPFQISAGDRWNGAQGGFGLGTGLAGFTYDGTGFMILRSPDGVNGPNFQFIGTGTVPNKSIRVGNNGQLQVLNHAYNTAIMQIDDGGNFKVTGTATGAMGQFGTATGGFSRWSTGTFATLLAGSGTIADTLQVGTIVGTNVPLLSVRGRIRAGRNDTSAAGGQILFDRAFDASQPWSLAVSGTGTAQEDVHIRFVNNLSGATPLRIWNDSLAVATHGTVAGNWFVGGTSTGAMSQWGTATGGFSRWGTSSAGLVQGTAAAVTGTSTAARFSGEGIVPTGCMLDYAGTASPPTGWLLANGTAVSRATYADLFGVIGTVWGTGDGATTFNLPDTRRRVSVGFGGTAVGTLGTAVGSTGGAETVALGTSEMPVHTHTQDSHNHTQDAHGHSLDADTMYKQGTEFGYDSGLFGFETGGESTGTTVATNQATTATNQNAGGGAAHENMQPSYVVQKIIKT